MFGRTIYLTRTSQSYFISSNHSQSKRKKAQERREDKTLRGVVGTDCNSDINLYYIWKRNTSQNYCT